MLSVAGSVMACGVGESDMTALLLCTTDTEPQIPEHAPNIHKGSASPIHRSAFVTPQNHYVAVVRWGYHLVLIEGSGCE